MQSSLLHVLTKAKAAQLINTWDTMSDTEFDELLQKWKSYDVGNISEAYEGFRSHIVDAFKDTLSQTTSAFL